MARLVWESFFCFFLGKQTGMCVLDSQVLAWCGVYLGSCEDIKSRCEPIYRISGNGWYIGQLEQITAGTVERSWGAIGTRRFKSAFELVLRVLTHRQFKSVQRPRYWFFEYVRFSRKSKEYKPFKGPSWYNPTDAAVKPTPLQLDCLLVRSWDLFGTSP